MSIPFFQAHSETSRQAAIQNTTADTHSERIYAQLNSMADAGGTMEQVKAILVAKGFIMPKVNVTPRFRDLELSGRIIKTALTRKTSSNRQANVYVTASVFNAKPLLFVRAPVKDASELAKALRRNDRLEAYLKSLIDVVRSNGSITIERNSLEYENLLREVVNND